MQQQHPSQPSQLQGLGRFGPSLRLPGGPKADGSGLTCEQVLNRLQRAHETEGHGLGPA